MLLTYIIKSFLLISYRFPAPAVQGMHSLCIPQGQCQSRVPIQFCTPGIYDNQTAIR